MDAERAAVIRRRIVLTTTVFGTLGVLLTILAMGVVFASAGPAAGFLTLGIAIAPLAIGVLIGWLIYR